MHYKRFTQSVGKLHVTTQLKMLLKEFVNVFCMHHLASKGLIMMIMMMMTMMMMMMMMTTTMMMMMTMMMFALQLRAILNMVSHLKVS